MESKKLRKSTGIRLCRQGLAHVVAQHGRTVVLWRRDIQTVAYFKR